MEKIKLVMQRQWLYVCVYVRNLSLYWQRRQSRMKQLCVCMIKNIVTNSHFWEEHTVARMAYLERYNIYIVCVVGEGDR